MRVQLEEEKFQFLIGTLKTLLTLRLENFQGLFQFLIGTLKTLSLMVTFIPRQLFQFLIGTLKTWPRLLGELL